MSKAVKRAEELIDKEGAVFVTPITDDNREGLVRLAMSMYLGERCAYCGRAYETLDDLKDTVWHGPHEHGRLACGSCWKQHHPED